MILKFRKVDLAALCFLEDFMEDFASKLRVKKVFSFSFPNERGFTVVDENEQPLKFSVSIVEKGREEKEYHWSVPLLSAVKNTPVPVNIEDESILFNVEVTIVEEILLSYNPPTGVASSPWKWAFCVPHGFVATVEKCFQRFEEVVEEKLDPSSEKLLASCRAFVKRKNL